MTIASMRQTAADLFSAAVKAADPGLAVTTHLASHPVALPKPGGQTLVIAIGKAAPAMLRAALDHIPGPVTALGVTHHENTDQIPGVTILTAGHPVPDADGLRAGEQILRLLDAAGPNDQVIALISGGGSALVPAPIAPLTLADKQAVSRVLLESGLDITAMNLVRQSLSDLKGGGFLRHAAPAPVTALILSDVIGDDLRAIASGPTVAPLGSRADAVKLLQHHNILHLLPDTAQQILARPDDTTALPKATNTLIGSNRQSLNAMLAAASGWDAQIVNDALTGDVADAANTILQAAQNTPVTTPTALIFGGETTVQIRGTGRGGRNQELALRIALAEKTLPQNWVFLSGGTDGRDGPVDAAGGLVDPSTTQRITASGNDPQALLNNNDSYAALMSSNDLLITGATGTNVADVQVMLLAP